MIAGKTNVANLGANGHVEVSTGSKAISALLMLKFLKEFSKKKRGLESVNLKSIDELQTDVEYYTALNQVAMAFNVLIVEVNEFGKTATNHDPLPGSYFCIMEQFLRLHNGKHVRRWFNTSDDAVANEMRLTLIKGLQEAQYSFDDPRAQLNALAADDVVAEIRSTKEVKFGSKPSESKNKAGTGGKTAGQRARPIHREETVKDEKIASAARMLLRPTASQANTVNTALETPAGTTMPRASEHSATVKVVNPESKAAAKGAPTSVPASLTRNAQPRNSPLAGGRPGTPSSNRSPPKSPYQGTPTGGRAAASEEQLW
jgi:hypothetical protein